MYKKLGKINEKPLPFEFYTAETLWNDRHISQQMLAFHLDKDSEPASRNHAFIARSIDWLTERFNIGPGTRVADFGCGPGLYSYALAEKGADVTGIDFSERSIKFARRFACAKEVKIDYVRENYLDYTTDGKFDLIIMIYCDFCALSPTQRQTMLQKFRDLLADDGAIVLDVFSLNAYAGRQVVSSFEHNLLNGFWSAKDYFGFVKTIKYDAEKVVLDKYTIIEEKRSFTVYNWLQYFDPDTLNQEFTDNGLKITELLSDVAGTPFDPESEEMAVIAVKA